MAKADDQIKTIDLAGFHTLLTWPVFAQSALRHHPDTPVRLAWCYREKTSRVRRLKSHIPHSASACCFPSGTW